MYPLFETIRIENGSPGNLPFHMERMARSCRDVLGLESAPSLPEPLEGLTTCKPGIFKCRISYGRSIGPVTIEPYHPRLVESLRLVTCDDIEYRYKYTDRSMLDRLFEQREGCDDILIVRGGRITDTSYSNIAFHDGNKYVTPSSPLLDGTMRKSLLAAGLLVEEDIRVKDLRLFKSSTLINSMLDPGRITISMDHII